MAGSLGRAASSFTTLPGDLSNWQGPSSVAFAQTAFESRDAAGRGARAFGAKALAADHLAQELEHAQARARTAIGHAKDARKRIIAAKADLADARRRLSQALIDIGAAEIAIAAADLLTGPPAGAIAERDRALKAADDARTDEGSAKRRLDDARGDLDDAQRLGRKAEHAAELAVGDANRTFGQIASDVPMLAPLGGPGMFQGTGAGGGDLRDINNVRSFLNAFPAGSATRADALRKMLGSSDPAIRAGARDALGRGAGNLGASRAGTLSRKLGPLGYPLGYAADRADGRGWLDSLGHTAASAAGSLAGGIAGSAACGALALGTEGIGAASCPALVGGGRFGGGYGAGKAYDAVTGHHDKPAEKPQEVRVIPPLVPVHQIKSADTIVRHHPLLPLPDLRFGGGRLEPLAQVGR